MRKITAFILAISIAFSFGLPEKANAQKIFGYTPGGEWVPFKVTQDGTLDVDATFSGTVEGASLLTDDNGDTAEITPDRYLQVVIGDGEGNNADFHRGDLEVKEQDPKRYIYDSGTGETLSINRDGEAKVDASVNVESGESIVVDDEGDTDNFRLQPTNGYTNVSIAPGNSQTVTFASSASRVSVNSTGATEYRYELNSASADTSSMPVYKGQYIKKGNGLYDQITFYNPTSSTENANITVEPEF